MRLCLEGDFVRTVDNPDHALAVLNREYPECVPATVAHVVDDERYVRQRFVVGVFDDESDTVECWYPTSL